MYLMCGISGSGKTTFSQNLENRTGIKRLGIDDFYKKINGDECKHENTFNVWIEFFKAIQELSLAKKDCIIDTNALTWHQRMQFIEWFPNFQHHIIFIDADFNLQKKNNKSRYRQVPDSAMDKMFHNLEKPTKELDVNWDTITYIQNINNSFQSPISVKGTMPSILNI